jgi:hypothetical protein
MARSSRSASSTFGFFFLIAPVPTGGVVDAAAASAWVLCFGFLLDAAGVPGPPRAPGDEAEDS